MTARRCLHALLALTILVATHASAQDGRFTFIGNYRGMERVRGGVVARADNGAVRIEQIAGVGFRIRYSFGAAFDSAASWAVIPDSLVFGDPVVRETPEALVVRGGGLMVSVQKRPLRLAIADTAGNPLMAESFGAGHQGARVTHIVARPARAHYFGIGEEPFPLDRAGTVLTMWNTDAGYHAGQTTPIYSSIPFYIAVNGGRAYGLFYDDSYKSEFDFGARLKNNVGFTADGGELRFYVFPGPALPAVLAEYSRLTGRTPLPPETSRIGSPLKLPTHTPTV